MAIGPDNGLSTVRLQAIACMVILSTGQLRNVLWWHFNQNSTIFIQENQFEDVICKMAAILFRS